MKVNLSTHNTRTQVPITITTSGSEDLPLVIVTPKDKNSLVEQFTVPLHLTATGSQGEFWFQNKGSYEVIIKSSKETTTQSIHVEDQYFLPFSLEFGVGAVLLILTLFGVFLWIKTTKKYAKS